MTSHKIFIFLILILSSKTSCDHCFDSQEKCGQNSKNSGAISRYLFYDVNPPEGFNLRRDVYMRFAVLAHKLSQSNNENSNNFKLVLPPWSRLVHWGYKGSPPEFKPWGLFFDLDSLKKFAPVIEMHEFFSTLDRSYQKFEIEETYILQHFEDMFTTGNFEDRMEVQKCTKHYNLNYFLYSNITSKSVKCLSYHGAATKLEELFLKTPAQTILVHHAEVALHEMYGGKIYWQARRSMRFNTELHKIAREFRENFLLDSDTEEVSSLPDDWRHEKSSRKAKGGSYLSVHLRRKDFLIGRADQVPSLKNISEQIIEKLKELQLTTVFIATDASAPEYKEIFRLLPSDYRAVRYKPTPYAEDKFGDGGVAIIDQIICSYSRFFIGTAESTFSFRIQEEREILGFPAETSFNCFCRDKDNCQQPSVWKIIY